MTCSRIRSWRKVIISAQTQAALSSFYINPFKFFMWFDLKLVYNYLPSGIVQINVNRMFNRGLNCLHKFILYHILSSPAQVEGYGGDRHPLSSLSVSSYTITKKQLIMKPHCCADCLSNACTYSRLLWASFGPFTQTIRHHSSKVSAATSSLFRPFSPWGHQQQSLPSCSKPRRASVTAQMFMVWISS